MKVVGIAGSAIIVDASQNVGFQRSSGIMTGLTRICTPVSLRMARPVLNFETCIALGMPVGTAGGALRSPMGHLLFPGPNAGADEEGADEEPSNTALKLIVGNSIPLKWFVTMFVHILSNTSKKEHAA